MRVIVLQYYLKGPPLKLNIFLPCRLEGSIIEQRINCSQDDNAMVKPSFIGLSPSGKELGFDPIMRWFESDQACFQLLIIHQQSPPVATFARAQGCVGELDLRRLFKQKINNNLDILKKDKGLIFIIMGEYKTIKDHLKIFSKSNWWN